jgi:magnesium transporter
MKEYTKEFMEDLHEIIARKDVELGRKLLADLHPADIAELFESLDIEDEDFFESLLDEEVAAEVLMEMDEDDRRRQLEQMPAKEIAETLELLDTDDAVDLLQELDEE